METLTDVCETNGVTGEGRLAGVYPGKPRINDFIYLLSAKV
jgi:hypothetical protein